MRRKLDRCQAACPLTTYAKPCKSQEVAQCLRNLIVAVGVPCQRLRFVVVQEPLDVTGFIAREGLIKLGMTKSPVTAAPPTPIATSTSPSPIPPSEVSLWHGESTNPVDGVRSQSFLIESNESDIGLFRRSAELFVASDEGHLRRDPHIGIGITVNQVVKPLDYEYNEYRTAVRLRWDDEKPKRQIWTISDSRTTIAPAQERAFLVQLLHHKRLALKFTFYPGTREITTFVVAGLDRVLRLAGIEKNP